MEKKSYYQVPQPQMNKLVSYRGNFQWGWGDEVDKEFLSIHMNDCSKMQNEYGNLYSALDALVEDAPYAGTWNNVQAITAFFRAKLNQIIEEVSWLFWTWFLYLYLISVKLLSLKC